MYGRGDNPRNRIGNIQHLRPVIETENRGGSAVWNCSKLRVKLEAHSAGIVGRPNGAQTEKTEENPYREEYDFPEDLYEDGDFEDLDEAYDAWENG